MGGEKSRLHRDSILGRPALSESLYRLSSSWRGPNSLWPAIIPDRPNKKQCHKAVDKVAAWLRIAVWCLCGLRSSCGISIIWVKVQQCYSAGPTRQTNAKVHKSSPPIVSEATATMKLLMMIMHICRTDFQSKSFPIAEVLILGYKQERCPHKGTQNAV